jgi:phosphate transport system substrate-binding protein
MTAQLYMCGIWRGLPLLRVGEAEALLYDQEIPLNKISPLTTTRLSLAAAVAVVGCAAMGPAALARDQIRIVGSSTVFPFSIAVAEQFGKQPGGKTPVVESTGSSAGIKTFCEGVGEQFPDIVNSSRRIKQTEIDACTAKGVTLSEVTFGYDGIVFVTAGEKAAALKRKWIWQAIAKEVPVDGKMVANPYKSWKDIDASLPDAAIVVYGPGPNHGTRDAVVELVMDKGCEEFAEVKAIGDEKARKKVCGALREDGAWVDVAESYNVTLERISKTVGAVGVVGFSYFDANKAKIKASTIDGQEASFDNIAGGNYAVSRPLYFYVKREHIKVIPGLGKFVAEFVSKKSSGVDGYLVEKGLIPLPASKAEDIRKAATEMPALEKI